MRCDDDDDDHGVSSSSSSSPTAVNHYSELRAPRLHCASLLNECAVASLGNGHTTWLHDQSITATTTATTTLWRGGGGSMMDLLHQQGEQLRRLFRLYR